MKTVRREKAAELVKAGWVGETYFCYAHNKYDIEGYYVLIRSAELTPLYSEWLHAPTSDEIAEVVSKQDAVNYYTKTYLCSGFSFYWDLFADWYFITRNSADAMAEVWEATHGKKCPQCKGTRTYYNPEWKKELPCELCGGSAPRSGKSSPSR